MCVNRMIRDDGITQVLQKKLGGLWHLVMCFARSPRTCPYIVKEFEEVRFNAHKSIFK
jgi:hypothetical protein